MVTISEAFSIAVQHHQAGRLQAAEQIYRQILAAEPDHPQAWHLLGVVAHQTGRHQAAIDCIQRSIRLDGNDARSQSNLGEAFRALGKLPEAIACYRRALCLEPDAAEIHYNLGIALKAAGQLAEAIAAFRRAVQLRPDHYGAHNNLGNALREHGELAEAVAASRRAVALRPDLPEAYCNLGLFLQDQGQSAEALACFRQALQLKPDAADAYVGLANALRSLGQPAEAIACLHQALRQNPDFAPIHHGLGIALQDLGQLTEAAASYRQALQLKPDYAGAMNNLAYVLGMEGKLDESLDCYRRVMELRPGDAALHSSYLITLQHRPGVSLAELADAHRAFDERHAAPLYATWRPHANSRDPQRRLRLGVLSPLFWSNPAAQLLVRPLEGLGRQPCDVLCYSCRSLRDRFTDRMAAAVHGWRNVSTMSDDALAEQIRSDGIDILLDVAGHLAQNRLPALARRPAPVQITWLAYEGTTGMAALDYILADQHVIPAGAEPHYRERVLRMPDGYVCYDPPAEAPAVGPLPALAAGHVTFASFSKPMKIMGDVVRSVGRDPRPTPRRPADAEIPGVRLPRGAGALRGTVPDRRDRARPHRVCRLVQAVRIARGIPPRGHRLGPLSLFGQPDHVRCAVDGSAGRHLSDGDVCRPAFADSPGHPGPDGTDRRRLFRLRTAGRGPGPRHSASGCALRRIAAAHGGLPAVRRAEVRRESHGPVARRMAGVDRKSGDRRRRPMTAGEFRLGQRGRRRLRSSCVKGPWPRRNRPHSIVGSIWRSGKFSKSARFRRSGTSPPQLAGNAPAYFQRKSSA